MKLLRILLVLIVGIYARAQNQLNIPSQLTGPTYSIVLDESTHEFYPGIVTNTMGANGPILGPTLILNQGSNVSLEVDNQLEESTTIHWHGLHVSPENDGGPHSVINSHSQWNPQFTVLDKAGLYWYHPHLHMMTDMHVSKGIAGLIIVRDNEEAGLGLPMDYGVDEFPVVLQTKGFDAAGQIEVHTNMDTSVMVNGTVDAQVNLPAQIVRLRVLNGSSQRVMEIGFSDNRSFSLIGTDGGLLSAPVSLTRYRMAPGQRADILLDLSGGIGQNFQLMSFGSELPNAVYGAAQPGMGPGATASLTNYTNNPLNGSDFELLDITVITQTASPVLSIPASLASFVPLIETSSNITRNLTFSSSGPMGDLNGPFLINGAPFNMSTINYTIPLNNTEVWSLTNQTPIAHPFHIHDVQFFILDINGAIPPPELQGYHDVVLVPAGMGNVRFIAKFENHSHPTIPYMYHCHMLTHEDDGMMGQFLVTDLANLEDNGSQELTIFPNPTSDQITIAFQSLVEAGSKVLIFNNAGQLVSSTEMTSTSNLFEASVADLNAGFYSVVVERANGERITGRVAVK